MERKAREGNEKQHLVQLKKVLGTTDPLLWKALSKQLPAGSRDTAASGLPPSGAVPALQEQVEVEDKWDHLQCFWFFLHIGDCRAAKAGQAGDRRPSAESTGAGAEHQGGSAGPEANGHCCHTGTWRWWWAIGQNYHLFSQGDLQSGHQHLLWAQVAHSAALHQKHLLPLVLVN